MLKTFNHRELIIHVPVTLSNLDVFWQIAVQLSYKMVDHWQDQKANWFCLHLSYMGPNKYNVVYPEMK